MRGIINPVKQLTMATVAAFGASSKNGIVMNLENSVASQKMHIKKISIQQVATAFTLSPLNCE